MGSHQTLTDFLLPEWDADRPASPRELAVAAGDHGTRYRARDRRGAAEHQGQPGAVHRQRAGLAAGRDHRREVRALRRQLRRRRRYAVGGPGRAAGRRQPSCTPRSARRWPSSTRALDAGFRPGMGNVVPDRFFWALPPEDEEGEDWRRPDGPPGRARPRTQHPLILPSPITARTGGAPAPCPLSPASNDDHQRPAVRARPAQVIPGGVNSPVRAFRAVGGTPRFIARAQGAYCGTPRARATSTTSAPGAR